MFRATMGCLTSAKCHKNTAVFPDHGPIVARNVLEIDKYTKNKLSTKLVLFTRLTKTVFETFVLKLK